MRTFKWSLGKKGLRVENKCVDVSTTAVVSDRLPYLHVSSSVRLRYLQSDLQFPFQTTDKTK